MSLRSPLSMGIRSEPCHTHTHTSLTLPHLARGCITVWECCEWYSQSVGVLARVINCVCVLLYPYLTDTGLLKQNRVH